MNERDGAPTPYSVLALSQVPRLLAHIDREPASATFGCADRDWWAWKFRDFPLGMAQTAAYPLALLWRHEIPGNPWTADERLLRWIEGLLLFAVQRQHRDGTFDAFAPNERDIGPTLGIAHGVAATLRVLGEALDDRLRSRLLDALHRALMFALPREERHGIISNHLGLFARAMLDGQALLGEGRFGERAARFVDRILEHQSEEGWYREYSGADPGYETLGICHLAAVWRETGDVRLLASLRRSVDFLSHFVHPDGSLGGTYGSRQTSLYYPAGFELLAPHSAPAAAVARFMRERLSQGRVLTPAVADLPNLVPLLYTYIEAHLTGPQSTAEGAPLPCESIDGVRRFPHAGLTVAGSGAAWIVVGEHRGGVYRLFDRQQGRLVADDAGFVIDAAGGRWTSQGPRDEAVKSSALAGIACASRFVRLRQELLTPVRLLVLRVLNLTAFRIPPLAALLRRLIVARLSGDPRPGPFALERTIEIDDGRVEIVDVLRRRSPVEVVRVARAEELTATHAGSARYFVGTASDPADLELPEATQQLARDGVATVRRTILVGERAGAATATGVAQ